MAYTKSLISFDPLNNISQYMHYDEDTDISHFESVGDATEVLEYNRALANDTDITKYGIKNDLWLYAKIPAIVQLKLMAEKGIDIYKKEHGNALSKVLEDPDYRYLKTTDRKHIIKAYD